MDGEQAIFVNRMRRRLVAVQQRGNAVALLSHWLWYGALVPLAAAAKAGASSRPLPPMAEGEDSRGMRCATPRCPVEVFLHNVMPFVE